MAIDPLDSACDALVAHLDSEVAELVSVIRGWPEHAEDLDVSGGPVCAVTHGRARTEPCNPITVDTSSDSGTTTVTYKVANLGFDVQIDVWAAHRYTRDETALAVLEALHNQLPHTPDLWLTHADYYSRPVTFELVSSEAMNTADGVERGLWRWRWTLRAKTDKVATKAFHTLSQLDNQVTATTGQTGASSVETDTVFT
jgi:hypothetical protein